MVYHYNNIGITLRSGCENGLSTRQIMRPTKMESTAARRCVFALCPIIIKLLLYNCICIYLCLGDLGRYIPRHLRVRRGPTL